MNNPPGLEIAAKIIIMVMLILFFTVVLIIILHLYFKCYVIYLHRNNQEAVTARRNRRLDIAVIHPASTATSRHLDQSILNSIPVLTVGSKDETIECAVCLSETLDGDKVRVLPKCNHGFHVECIDTWFASNSTCPICRNTISNQPESEAEAEENSAVTSLSLNSEEQITSSSSSSSSLPSNIRPDEMVVIEMPRRIDEDEETNSPVMKQLKSFKRLLSMGTTRVSPSSSSNSGKMGPDQC